MKLPFCLTIFCVICGNCVLGQIPEALIDCSLFEKIVNDSSVKGYLFSREHFVAFTNYSHYFRNCESVIVNGKKYAIYDSTEREMLSGYLSVHIYERAFNEIDKGNANRDAFYVILDYVPQEQGALIAVEKIAGNFVVSLKEIFRED